MLNVNSRSVKQARIKAWLTQHNQFLSKDELNFLQNMALYNQVEATQSSLINQLEDSELDYLDAQALEERELKPFYQCHVSHNVYKILIYIETINLSYAISKSKDNNPQCLVETIINNLCYLGNAEKIFYINLIFSEENKPLKNIIDDYYLSHQLDNFYYLMKFVKEIHGYPQLLEITRNKSAGGITYKQILERLQYIHSSSSITNQGKSALYFYLEQTLRQVSIEYNEKLFYKHYFRIRSIIIIEEINTLAGVDNAINDIENLHKEFGRDEDVSMFQILACEAFSKLEFSDEINAQVVKKFRSLSLLQDIVVIRKLDFLQLYFEIKSILNSATSLPSLCANKKFTDAWESYIVICNLFEDCGLDLFDSSLQPTLLGIVFARCLLLLKDQHSSIKPRFLLKIDALSGINHLINNDVFKKSYQNVLTGYPEKLIVMNNFLNFYHCNNLEFSSVFRQAEKEKLSFSTIVNDVYWLMTITASEKIIIQCIYDWFLSAAHRSNHKEKYLEIAKAINCFEEITPASSLFFSYRNNRIFSYFDKLNYQLTGRFQSVMIQDDNVKHYHNNEAFDTYQNFVL